MEIQVANNMFSSNSRINGKVLFELIENWLETIISDNEYKSLNKIYFPKPKIKFIIKEVPNLLGGFRLNFLDRSTIMDFTILNKINQVSKLLK